MKTFAKITLKFKYKLLIRNQNNAFIHFKTNFNGKTLDKINFGLIANGFRQKLISLEYVKITGCF